jgi:membrane protein required for colicin V production
LNWLDAVLLFIFLVALVGGAKNGLVKTVISLAALIVGVVLAVRFYPEFGSWLQKVITSQTASRAVAFIIILFGVVVIGSLASVVAGRLLSSTGLGWIDKVGGAVMGLVIAAIVFGGILSLMVSSSRSGWMEGSINGSFMASFLLNHFLPALGALSPFFGNPRGWLDRMVY